MAMVDGQSEHERKSGQKEEFAILAMHEEKFWHRPWIQILVLLTLDQFAIITLLSLTPYCLRFLFLDSLRVQITLHY